MDLATLKQFVKEAPNKPGNYRYLAPDGQLLYIGKAASIKKRLASYLKTEDDRIRQMISRAAQVEFVPTDSDIEALILESQLIKQKRPMFNVMLRDDKQYFYVAITAEDFPRLYLTHQTTGRIKQRNHDIKEYIGPFTDGAALKATLKFLRTVFPYCTCTQKHHNYCLNYHIGKCLGFCCLKAKPTSEQKMEYAKNIKAIRDVLSGRKNTLIEELKKEMDQQAQSEDFETAIAIRNRIEKLERVFENARIIKHSEILKAHRQGLQMLVKSKNPIIRIEGYDISNIQGEHATGSMVTFVHGEPDKNYYRKFNIKTVRGANDTAMLQEILERRFQHTEWPFPDLVLIDGGKGQVNAARATLAAMNIKLPIIGIAKDEKHFGKQIVIPGRKNPILLKKLSPTDKNLLLFVDTEAHRFAISHYRFRHGKTLR